MTFGHASDTGAGSDWVGFGGVLHYHRREGGGVTVSKLFQWLHENFTWLSLSMYVCCKMHKSIIKYIMSKVTI